MSRGNIAISIAVMISIACLLACGGGVDSGGGSNTEAWKRGEKDLDGDPAVVDRSVPIEAAKKLVAEYFDKNEHKVTFTNEGAERMRILTAGETWSVRGEFRVAGEFRTTYSALVKMIDDEWELYQLMLDDDVVTGTVLGDSESTDYTPGIGPPMTAAARDYYQRENKRLPASRSGSSLRLNIGSVGKLPDLSIISIADHSSILATLVYGGEFNFDRQVDAIIHGVSTSNIVDGATVSYQGVYRVKGTVEYTTVLGASRRVYEIEPVSSSLLASWERQIDAERWTDRWNAESRLWTDRSGDYTVEAIYDGYLSEGVIRLLKHDRTTVELPMTRLSGEDRRFAVEASREERARENN